MARGDGIHRTSARNMRMTTDKVSNAQGHNEREKESYVNQDIVPERQGMNVHFKTPTADYTAMFDQMVADGTISTRGLKADAEKFGELIFDVNSAYFYNNGGYDFAKQFYAEAYKSAIEIVGGEQYILSAVMHADERNRAMSEALGQDVYHYHLHVVYEQDMIDALDSGKISYAYLDVLNDEFPNLDTHPLANRPNVFLTPHSAFYSQEAMYDGRVQCCEDVLNFFNGNYDKCHFVPGGDNTVK